jgi:hypothetical protein
MTSYHEGREGGHEGHEEAVIPFVAFVVALDQLPIEARSRPSSSGILESKT